jgi:hypothetical protein
VVLDHGTRVLWGTDSRAAASRAEHRQQRAESREESAESIEQRAESREFRADSVL